MFPSSRISSTYPLNLLRLSKEEVKAKNVPKIGKNRRKVSKILKVSETSKIFQISNILRKPEKDCLLDASDLKLFKESL